MQLLLFAFAAFFFQLAACETKSTEEAKSSQQLYEQFVRKFARKYKSEEERQNRFEIFSKSLKRIEELNKRNDGVVYGITQFADWTDEEFQQMLMPVRNPTTMKKKAVHFPRFSRTSIPESFDWRDKNGVTPVRNQGSCGSCWAFATVAVIESAIAIRNNRMVDLSEQELVECDTAQAACNGGWGPYAIKFAQSRGLMNETEYPYLGTDGNGCHLKSPTVFPTYIYPELPTDADYMAQYIYQIGPIGIGFYASTDFKHYTSGIWRNSCPPGTNHEVLAVGYGVENGTKYWIAKNSWDVTFGEKGYFKIERGSNLCYFESMPYGAQM